MLTDEVVATIAQNQKKTATWPWVLTACFFLWLFTLGISLWVFLAWTVFSVWLTVFLYEKDSRDNKQENIQVQYPDTMEADPQFIESRACFEKLIASQRIWRIVSSSTVQDRKHNAGAGAHVVRWGAKAGYGLPRSVTSNITIPFLKGSQTLYFFPDALLLCDRKGCARISYDQIRIDTGTTRFIEGMFYPREAPLLEYTWQVVNAKGGPDKRVKNNRKRPVVRYDVLEICCKDRYEETFHLSAPGSADAFADGVRLLRRSSISSAPAGIPARAA